MSDPRQIIYYNRTVRRKTWLVIQVVLPVVFCFGIWLAATFLFTVPDAFGKTFAGGDLILIGALLLLGIMADLYTEQKSNPKLTNLKELDGHYFCGLILGCIFLMIYCFFQAVDMRAENRANYQAVAKLQDASRLLGSYRTGTKVTSKSVVIYNNVLNAAIRSLNQETKQLDDADKAAQRRVNMRAWACLLGGAFAILWSVVSTYKSTDCILKAITAPPAGRRQT